jgi:hypothetical protein
MRKHFRDHPCCPGKRGFEAEQWSSDFGAGFVFGMTALGSVFKNPVAGLKMRVPRRGTPRFDFTAGKRTRTELGGWATTGPPEKTYLRMSA